MLTVGNLCFEGEAFEANLSNYDAFAVDKAEHTDELSSDGLVNLRIDYKVSGVGSNSCGPALMEKYRLSEKDIKFAFTVRPEVK